MTFLIGLFARWGVPESLRRPLLYIGAAFAAIALLAVLRGCYDRAVTDRYEAKVNLQAEKGARAADAKAADQRLNDTMIIKQEERDYGKIIDAAPTGAPDAAAIALACERLRRVGKNTTAIPACSGRTGAH